MVDRGPDSAGVVKLFMEKENLYSLKGNRENVANGLGKNEWPRELFT